MKLALYLLKRRIADLEPQLDLVFFGGHRIGLSGLVGLNFDLGFFLGQQSVAFVVLDVAEFPAVVVDSDLHVGKVAALTSPSTSTPYCRRTRGQSLSHAVQVKRLQECLAELLGHEAVEDKVNGRVGDGHHVHEFSEGRVTLEHEGVAQDGGENTQNALETGRK